MFSVGYMTPMSTLFEGSGIISMFFDKKWISWSFRPCLTIQTLLVVLERHLIRVLFAIGVGIFEMAAGSGLGMITWNCFERAFKRRSLASNFMNIIGYVVTWQSLCEIWSPRHLNLEVAKDRTGPASTSIDLGVTKQAKESRSKRPETSYFIQVGS